MSETRQPWTPGSWEASPQDRVLSGPLREEYADWIILAGDDPDDDEGIVVAKVYNAAEERTEANAVLFAAADELAKACAAVVTRYDSATTDAAVSRKPRRDPPDVAACRAALDACGWKWGGT
jgi:hypothetical protein